MDAALGSSSPVLAALLVAVAVAYGFMLLWFRWGMGRYAPPRPGPLPRPEVSVVVAARDEEQRLGQCLALLGAQDYPADQYDVIVVDDGSRDRTAQVAEAAARDSHVPMELVRLKGGAGKKAAMACGVARARGEIVLTTDADCQVSPAWVATMAAHFDADDVGMVVGFSQIGAPGRAYTRLEGWEAEDFLLLMAAAMGSTGAGHPMAASGQSLGFRRAAWIEVGGYESVMHRVSGDDALLLQLIRRTARWQVRFAADPRGASVHPPSGGARALLRQRVRWASNGPYLRHLDAVLFAHLSLTWSANALVALSPALCWAGLVPVRAAAAAWAVKVGAELVLHQRAARVFRRPDLHWHFALWAAVQPYYVAVAGALGALGRFTWKGRQYRGGEAPERGGPDAVTDRVTESQETP